MIYGVGVDIVEIKRIKRLMKKEAFIRHVFSQSEISKINSVKSDKRRAELMAGSFAAKEAYAKAMGTGFVGFSMSDVTISRNDNGAPYIIEPASQNKKHDVKLSISHESEYAVAFVVIQEAEG